MLSMTMNASLALLLFISYTDAAPSVEKSDVQISSFTTSDDTNLSIYVTGDEQYALLVLHILFDDTTYDTKQVRYTITHHTGSLPDTGKCANYQLGDKFINTEVFQTAYGDENLQKKLREIKLVDHVELENSPTSETKTTLHIISQTPEKVHVRSTTHCTVTLDFTYQPSAYTNQNLTPQLLAPTRFFKNKISRDAICTLLNTAPIWDKTTLALKRIHTLVDKISARINNLNVITGTFGTLEYVEPTEPGQTPDIESNRCKMKKLNSLHDDQKINVPQIIYNVFYHRIITAEKTIDYGVILVTANSEWTQKMDTYCVEVPCTDINWHNVNRNSRGQQEWQTNCCVFSDENLQKFQIRIDWATDKQPLDLTNVYRDAISVKNNRTTNVLEGIILSDE